MKNKATTNVTDMTCKGLVLLLPYLGIVLGFQLTRYDKLHNDAFIRHGFDVIRVGSAQRCCLLCYFHTDCVSVSLEKETSTCQLNNRNPIDYPVAIDVLHGWVSYKRMSAPCEYPWTLYNRHCYLVETSLKNWTQAEDNCLTHGGHLVDFLDEIEADFVNSLVQLAVTGPISDFWCGLNDRVEEGTFVYTSGLNEMYVLFSPNEPADLDAANCVEVWANARMNDAPCSVSKSSVCEKVHY